MATAGDCAGDAASMRAAFDLCVDVSVTTEEPMASVVRALEQPLLAARIYAMRFNGTRAVNYAIHSHQATNIKR